MRHRLKPVLHRTGLRDIRNARVRQLLQSVRIDAHFARAIAAADDDAWLLQDMLINIDWYLRREGENRDAADRLTRQRSRLFARCERQPLESDGVAQLVIHVEFRVGAHEAGDIRSRIRFQRDENRVARLLRRDVVVRAKLGGVGEMLFARKRFVLDS